MSISTTKLSIALAWPLAIGAVAFLSEVASPSGWLLVTVSAIGPPLAMMHYWREPEQTMSESIRQSIR